MRNRLETLAGEQGSAAIDSAITLTLILTVMFGLVDVGRTLYAYQYVADSARNAVRFASVRGKSCSGLTGGCPATSDDIKSYVQGHSTGITTSGITVNSSCIPTASLPYSPPCSPGDPVKVTVQYSFAFVSPLKQLSWNMSSSSQMVDSQ